MKKILFAILILLPFAVDASAASYYGCASAAINADNTFCTTATGSCTGDTPVAAAVALSGTHSLFANGCTITIPNTADLTVTAAKLSNKDDGGAMVDGGQFTYVTANDYELIMDAVLETGGTTGAVLAISGTGTHNPVVSFLHDITAGSAASMHGVNDSHTVGTVLLGSVGVPITVKGGTNSTARGYYHSGASGTFVFYGTALGNSGPGFYLAGATATANITGACQAGETVGDAFGCYGGGAGGITLIGDIINSTRATGIGGNVVWNPTAPSSGVTGHYIKTAGTIGAAAGTEVFVGKNTDDATKALGTFYYIDPTDGGSDVGTATSGGGAWAQ